jgi:uncharacterized membrane protein YfcA
MSIGRFALLAVVGIGGGLTASIAGLASLVSYPALLLLGLSPIAANVTNTVALTLNGVGSIAGSGPELMGQRARVVRLSLAAAAGGALGGALLLLTPAAAFEKVVPWLIGGASLFILVPRRRAVAGEKEPAHSPWIALATFAIGIYAGYFGAASGVMMFALLLAFAGDSLPRSVAVKNVAMAAANAVAAIFFMFLGPVDWAVALPLSLGFLIGGRLGPAVVRRLPTGPLKVLIALGGLGLALRLGFQAYR